MKTLEERLYRAYTGPKPNCQWCDLSSYEIQAWQRVAKEVEAVVDEENALRTDGVDDYPLPVTPRYVLRWRSDGEYLTSMPNASEARWGERKEALEMTKGAAVEKLSLWGNQSVALVRVRGT